MTKFLAALAGSRDTTDVNIAAGEAIPRWTTFKNVLLGGLAVTCVLLAAGYVTLLSQVDGLEEKVGQVEKLAVETRKMQIENMKMAVEAAKIRDQLLTEFRAYEKMVDDFTGQYRASTPSQP